MCLDQVISPQVFMAEDEYSAKIDFLRANFLPLYDSASVVCQKIVKLDL